MDMHISPGPRHSRVVMLLHWLIAIAVIVNWRLVEAGEGLPRSEHEAIMAKHFSLGVVIFTLTVLLIVWKLTHKMPPLSANLQRWEVVLAKSVHGLFYTLLIVMPMLGWIAMSSFGNGIDVFGLFTWPALPLPKNPKLAGSIFDIHAALGIFLVILVGLHIAGTLKHTLIDKDGNLFRMLPFGQPKG